MSQVANLRVLMLSDVYFPRINGVSTSIETFRHDLGDCGIETTLVAPAYPEIPAGTPADTPVDADAAADIRRVAAWQLPFDPEDRLMSRSALQRTLADMAGQAWDLVHIQTPFAAHYAGVRFGRQHSIPVVSTYHTHFEEYLQHYLPLLPRPLLRAIARSIVRHQCKSYDKVIVPSLAMRETLQGYGVSRPLEILPTGIPIGQFAQGDRAAFRARYQIAPERPVALCVGRVAHEKNIDFLLVATEHLRHDLPDILLLIAGDGPALPGLKQRVRTLGIEANVRFVGYLDRATELANCYAAADVFVFASKTETQGLVLLEAMAAGLPVYALAELGTRDILEPRRGAVVAEDNTSQFATGLEQLLRDQAQRHRLSEAGRRWAAEWSSPERARQLAGLYRSLVAEKSSQQHHQSRTSPETAVCASPARHQNVTAL